MSRRTLTPEGAVKSAVMDLLAAERITAFRMQTGMLRSPSGNPVWFGVKGMADILALPFIKFNVAAADVQQNRILNSKGTRHFRFLPPLWIECKAAVGRQSQFQKSFQSWVEERGMSYLIVRRPEDLRDWMREHLGSRA